MARLKPCPFERALRSSSLEPGAPPSREERERKEKGVGCVCFASGSGLVSANF